MKNVSEKFCRKNEKKVLCSIYIYIYIYVYIFQKPAICKTMSKNLLVSAGHRWKYNKENKR